MQEAGYRVPRESAAREALREKGQFWTPRWVAEAMVAYVLGGEANELFDPAVGAGAFFAAAKAFAAGRGQGIALFGRELHPEALQQASANGLTGSDLGHVEIGDFIQHPPAQRFKAIVANPPYIRHHRLSHSQKAYVRSLGAEITGRALDGRAGLHVYFLIRALQMLDAGGRLAFIMPADTCEGVFASHLWNWIASRFRLDGVVTFAPEASPFPGVDTNPLIFMISNRPPSDHLMWAQCTQGNTDNLTRWISSGLTLAPGEGLRVCRRDLAEALATGPSRPPLDAAAGDSTLGEFAFVVRGIATGANEFFHLTRAQADDLGIPGEFLVPTIGRTRDVAADEITADTLLALDQKGRPTLLFPPDGRPIGAFPRPVQEYIRRGEDIGLPQRPLLSTRQPWYKMERRPVPPILFAYLGRRNARFLRNTAGVVPLSCFLCVYPRNATPVLRDALWEVLQAPTTVANLALVGKSYGGGALKVEPRALECLRLPAGPVAHAGLARAPQPTQLSLC
jgi:hypothetical protein